MDPRLIELELKQGEEGAILHFKDKSIEELEKEYDEVNRIINNMVREFGTEVYENIDYWYLLGWRKGVAKLLERRRGGGGDEN